MGEPEVPSFAFSSLARGAEKSRLFVIHCWACLVNSPHPPSCLCSAGSPVATHLRGSSFLFSWLQGASVYSGWSMFSLLLLPFLCGDHENAFLPQVSPFLSPHFVFELPYIFLLFPFSITAGCIHACMASCLDHCVNFLTSFSPPSLLPCFILLACLKYVQLLLLIAYLPHFLSLYSTQILKMMCLPVSTPPSGMWLHPFNSSLSVRIPLLKYISWGGFYWLCFLLSFSTFYNHTWLSCVYPSAVCFSEVGTLS